MRGYARCFLIGLCILIFTISAFAQDQAEAKYAGSTSVQAYVIMETEAEITQDESVTPETRVDENTLKPAKTGDDTPVMLWTAVFSGACILFWTVKRFKNT